MKTVYFSNKKMPWLFRKSVFVFSHSLASIAPPIAIKLSKKLLFNPFSRRQYKFRNITQPEEFIVPISMGNISCLKFGNGKNQILLIHGWGDTTLRFSPLIKTLLQGDNTIWCFDHIGHGNSFGSYSHLFGCIEGVQSVSDFIHSKGYRIDKIITHSMGGLALLNMPDSFLSDKKIAIISLPVKFFESMFQKLDNLGLSQKLMDISLNRISKEYAIEWRSLMPNAHKYKINANFTFLHDKDDEFSSLEDVKNFLENTSCNFSSTSRLGHNGILKDANALNQISNL